MNFSTAVFLINEKARAISVCYDPTNNKEKDLEASYLFKTLDPNIEVDSLVIIPTGTRVGFTIAKATAVDVEIDFESTIQLKWVAGLFSRASYDQTLADEAKAIEIMKAAEFRHKREELRSKMTGLRDEELASLAISDGTKEVPPAA
jgi:hypothetical protein